MTTQEIIRLMLTREPLQLFRSMQLGGRISQLAKMEADGLIRSQKRYLGGNRQRDWYLTEEQHAKHTASAKAAALDEICALHPKATAP